MNDENSAQSSAIAQFRALHESGCFVLPNPRDAGTAVYLQQLGFKALATTSAGFAFSRGKPDGAILFGEMLSHIGEVVAATRLPVNAHFLNGSLTNPTAFEPLRWRLNVERFLQAFPPSRLLIPSAPRSAT